VAGAPTRQFEPVAQDALDAHAREHSGLDGHLVLGVHVDAAADARVLALRVLADADDVNILRALVPQGAWHAGQKAHRPQVDVFVERLPRLGRPSAPRFAPWAAEREVA